LVQYTLPLCIGILLAGVIENAASANTWSVISTLLHNSWLHAVLRSDSIPSKYIARPVRLISYLSIASAGLMTLTTVLIPLGVKDGFESHNVPGLRFELAVDNDSFSLGTADNQWYSLTRVCGVDYDKCPGQESETGEEEEGSFQYRIGSEVPASLLALFGKASHYGASVASVFEIQFRNYLILQKEEYKLSNGLKYVIGQFRFLETMILHPGYKVIDGLVVDMKAGGVGFRAHAVPDRQQKRYGASWEETLLWVVPETVCVSNNLSLRVTTNDEGGSVSVLVDMGGSSAAGQDPKVAPDVKGVPDLAARAWSGAYFFNKDIGAGGGKEGEQYDIDGNGVWIETLKRVGDELGGSLFAVRRPLLTSPADTHCAGITASTASGAPLVTCGLVIGAPRRNDGQGNTLAGAYSYPLYTCATALRASLQTTHFGSEGATRYLASVNIYNSTLIDSPPLWGVETRANLTTDRYSPLWGPLHPDDERAANVKARRADFLYLPAGQGGDGITDSLAGTGAYQYAASFMYNETSPLTPDYSGRTNYALYRQWATITADADKAGALPGMIWTDVFANLATSVSTGGKGAGLVRVQYSVVRYKLLYTIPGMMLLLLWLCVFVAAMVLWARRRVSLRQVRLLLNQLSTGRLVVNMLAGGRNGALPPKKWAKQMGRTVVGLQVCHAGGAEVMTQSDLTKGMDGLVVRFVGGQEEEREALHSVNPRRWSSWRPGASTLGVRSPDYTPDDSQSRRPGWTPGRRPDWMPIRFENVPVEGGNPKSEKMMSSEVLGDGWVKDSEISQSNTPSPLVVVPVEAPEDRSVMDVLTPRK
ncbi:hypothetical protein DFP73DRAFT_480589, partial [Morchella snyderi]